MTKLYGPDTSRVLMCAWVMQESNISFEHVRLQMDQIKSPEFLEINPNGKVPVLVDDDLVLYESMAISLYLAGKYGRAPFWPESEAARAQALQWAFWGATELEPPLVSVFGQVLFTPPGEKDPAAESQARHNAGKVLELLEAQLQDRAWVLGEAFSISDIHLSCLLAPVCELARFDLTPWQAVLQWYAACKQRPGFEPMQSALDEFALRLQSGQAPW